MVVDGRRELCSPEGLLGCSGPGPARPPGGTRLDPSTLSPGLGLWTQPPRASPRSSRLVLSTCTWPACPLSLVVSSHVAQTPSLSPRRLKSTLPLFFLQPCTAIVTSTPRRVTKRPSPSWRGRATSCFLSNPSNRTPHFGGTQDKEVNRVTLVFTSVPKL